MCAAAATDYRYLSYEAGLKGVKTNVGANKVGIALFGLGRIGTIHFEKILSNPRSELLYCVEKSQSRTDYVQNKWKLSNTRMLTPTESDVIFCDPQVTAVVICTPTQTHEQLVKKALESGKAVLCEKPLSLTIEGTVKCYEAASKAGKPLLCAFNRRFDPGFKNIKDRVERGDVGQIQVVKTCSRDSTWPSLEYLNTSGGLFHDCAIHDIDLICWILGELPTSVYAHSHAFNSLFKDIDDFDTAGIVMNFPSGVISLTDLSRSAVYGYDQRIEVFGSKGMLNSGNIRPTGVVSHCSNGSTAVPICYSFASRYNDAYSFEIEHFLDTVQGFSEAEIRPHDTYATSKIASACEESARTGKIVKINWEQSCSVTLL
ncbi:putative oxidoreductase YrbE [Tachypleus tridentatus]|uniref:putative oxidoreductase YrbE n=1 Tax=Tachypleus tridentatus TaxID=6853 RepID=UPI003FD096AA